MLLITSVHLLLSCISAASWLKKRQADRGRNFSFNPALSELNAGQALIL